MRKSLWSPDEDALLKRYVTKHGCGNWSDVAKITGLRRCGKSCRLRWINYLRPDLKRGPFSAEEIRIIVNLHRSLGNSWSRIATYLPGRTDNDIKNFWHSYTRNRRLEKGDDQANYGQSTAMAGCPGILKEKECNQCSCAAVVASEMEQNGSSYSQIWQDAGGIQADLYDAMTGCAERRLDEIRDAITYVDSQFATPAVSQNFHNRKPAVCSEEKPPEGLQSVVWSFVNRQLPPSPAANNSSKIDNDLAGTTPEVMDELCRGYHRSFMDLQAEFIPGFRLC